MLDWLFGKGEDESIKVLNSTFFNVQTIDNRLKVRLISKDILDTSKVIIIKFGTESCPACKMFRQPLKSFEIKNKENIETYEVDITYNQELAQQLRIMGVPTNYIFFKGELFDVSVGASLKDIVQKISKLGIQIK